MRHLSSDFGFFLFDPLRDFDHSTFGILLISGHFVDELNSRMEIFIEVVGHSEVFDLRAVVLLPVFQFLVKAFDVLD
jgi:hypothetical protein